MRTELTDGHIVMRALGPDDANAIYDAVRESIAELSPWMRWCHAGYTRREATGWTRQCVESWASGREYNFAILDAARAELLGGCGLNDISLLHRRANLGYWVRTSRTGHGVAVRAVRLVASVGLHDLGLQRLEIIVATANERSRRVAEKSGAAFEGVLFKRLALRDLQSDACSFSITAA